MIITLMFCFTVIHFRVVENVKIVAQMSQAMDHLAGGILTTLFVINVISRERKALCPAAQCVAKQSEVHLVNSVDRA